MIRTESGHRTTTKSRAASSVGGCFFSTGVRVYLENNPTFKLSNLFVSFANQTLKRMSICGSASIFGVIPCFAARLDAKNPLYDNSGLRMKSR
jgi:hypothetical protein